MATTQKKNKYTLADSANMLRGLSSGDKSKQVDANGDGKMNLSDVSTMMKFTAGWSPETAMDPYKGKEVTPRDYGKSQEYLLGKVVNREPFEFSGTDSPLYKAYAKQYKRGGDLAAKDTLSKVSARTGGVPSSYAVTATAAQQNQYAGAMADKIPELYQTEYNQYAADAERDRADLGTLIDVKNNDLSYAGTLAEYGDYSGLEGMGVDTSKLKNSAAWNEALRKAEYGDYSGLAALGVDLTKINSETAWNEALKKAEYGDYSGLAALGVDLTKINSDTAWNDALRKAEYGDYSGLAALGVDTSYAKSLQSQALSSGSESESATEYTDTDSARIEAKLSMGAVYWDDEVKEFARSVYGMEPIELWYYAIGYDQGYTFYDSVCGAFVEKGIDPSIVETESEWNERKTSNVTFYSAEGDFEPYTIGDVNNYTDYLREIAKQFL